MKILPVFLSLFLIFLVSCDELSEKSSSKVQIKTEFVTTEKSDFRQTEMIYLPVYSDIYFSARRDIMNLTATISIHNIDPVQNIYILSGDYYNTEGEKQENYFPKTVVIGPLKTMNFVVDRMDTRGGTGANFLFEWSADSMGNRPLIEAVMIATENQQGISFITRGVPIVEYHSLPDQDFQ